VTDTKGNDVTDTKENDVTDTATVQTVAEALSEVLGYEHSHYTPETELFGSLPELDSLALLELITVIEERFDFEMNEDDITAEVFGTVASLAGHIDERRA
jgi:acyl carrier protein